MRKLHTLLLTMTLTLGLTACTLAESDQMPTAPQPVGLAVERYTSQSPTAITVQLTEDGQCRFPENFQGEYLLKPTLGQGDDSTVLQETSPGVTVQPQVPGVAPSVTTGTLYIDPFAQPDPQELSQGQHQATVRAYWADQNPDGSLSLRPGPAYEVGSDYGESVILYHTGSAEPPSTLNSDLGSVEVQSPESPLVQLRIEARPATASVQLLFMTAEHRLLERRSLDLQALPEAIDAPEQAAYLVVDATGTDGGLHRSFCNPGDSFTLYLPRHTGFLEQRTISFGG